MNKGSLCHNRSIKSWLQDNDIEMYFTHNEMKSFVAEKFIRTIRTLNKYTTSLSKNVHIDELDVIVNKYNNTYYSTIKMMTVDVKSSTYIEFGIKNNDKYLKFKVGDHVTILKYENNFAKGYVRNGSEEVFMIKKVKNTVTWTYVIEDPNVEEIIGTLYERELQKKKNQENFRVEKIIEKNSCNLCVK